MRELTLEELELVAGGQDTGDIVVTGDSGGDSGDWGDWGDFGDFGDTGDSGGGGGDCGSGPPPAVNGDHQTTEEVRNELTDIQGVKSALQDLADKFHNNVSIKIGDHIVPITEALEDLGKLGDAVAVGTVGVELATGNQNWFKDGVALAFGATVTAAASEAGAPALAAWGLGTGAEFAANHAVDWIDAWKDNVQDMETKFADVIQEYVNNNSNIPAGTYNNPVDMLEGMFGAPPPIDP